MTEGGTEHQLRLDLDRVDYPECEGQDCSKDATTLLKLSGATRDELVICDNDECHPFWMGAGAPSIDDRIPLTPRIVVERSIGPETEADSDAS